MDQELLKLKFEDLELKPVELQGNGLNGNGIMGNGINCPIESDFNLYLKDIKL